jgi:exodeoxyribonuclease VII small subunit
VTAPDAEQSGAAGNADAAPRRGRAAKPQRAAGSQSAAGQAAPGQPEAGRPPYEQARDELIELVKRLEAGGLTLEQSLQLWERGERLAAICEEWLEGARARLATAMAQNGEDKPPSAPF